MPTRVTKQRPSLLDRPIDTLPGIGDKRAELLGAIGIETVRDLVFHFPRDYQDRRTITPISELEEGDTATIEVEIVSARPVRLRGRMSMAVATLRDGSGEINAVWFGRDYLARTFKPGARALFTGLVGKWKGLSLRNPEYELLSGDDEDTLNTGRIVPIYKLTEGVTQRMLRRVMYTALEQVEAGISETLPESLRKRHDFPEIADAIRVVHFPESVEEARTARNRFAYEELLGIQLGVLTARATRHLEETGLRHEVGGARLRGLRASLPFELTDGQRRAVDDILDDMASSRPMVRLLQGDVGCGKTVVALHAIAAAADGGFQTALMAPTEILAEQHALSLREFLAPLGLQVESLTGSTRDAKGVRERVAEGAAHVVVGTHALIQDATLFRALGLSIVDEQHRFGVLQRGALSDKGLNVDTLHMTATPIPRTLAITVYGGMDLSLIEELPPDRRPIETRRVIPSKVDGVYRHIHKQAEAGAQTYFICPLVEESTKRDLVAVTSHYEELRAGPFADLRVGLVHGRLSAAEKDDAMHRFKRGELDVLFSTTVIEVGIDCPNATTIVIEDAGQFGLPQLHQLRGRVGRGAKASTCFLLGKPKTKEGKQRIDIMCSTTSGFDIAEADFVMRGPGEFHGVRQAGLSDLRVADLVRDSRLLDQARRDAQATLKADPDLKGPELAHVAAIARRFEATQA